MSPQIKAQARVKVVLEFELGTTWGMNCPMTQVYEQAAEQVLRQIQVALGDQQGFSIVGVPVVVAILTSTV